MDGKSKKISQSLSAFVGKLAKQLRIAVKSTSLKGRAIKEKNGLSTSNKIGQIALLLRSEVKKLGRRKKKQN